MAGDYLTLRQTGSSNRAAPYAGRAVVVAVFGILAFVALVFGIIVVQNNVVQNSVVQNSVRAPNGLSDLERIRILEGDVARLQVVRLATLEAGPVAFDDIRLQALRDRAKVKAKMTSLLTAMPSSPVTKQVLRSFRDYNESFDAQLNALQRGDKTAAVHLAPLSFDSDLATLRQSLPAQVLRPEQFPGRLTGQLVSAAAIGALVVVSAFSQRRVSRSDARSKGAERSVALHNGATVFATDEHMRIVHFNVHAAELFSETQSLLGMDLETLCNRSGAAGLLAVSSSVMLEGKAETVELLIGQAGSARRFDAIASPVTTVTKDGVAITSGIVWDLHDSTHRQGLQNELEHKAFHDHLTGLPNRALFRDRASHALERKTREGMDSQNVCVLFIDLDGFKHVNDSLGHEAGDDLIVEVSFRLTSMLRPGDTLARIGGDEFAVLLEDPRPKLADLMADRLLGAIRQPFRLRGREIHVGASIGLAEAGSRSTVEEMLRNADTAMYAAKGRGKNRIERFQQTMFTDAMERIELDGELRRAAESGQLRLYYQPIVELATLRFAGVEALIRWHHPVRGIVPPTVFIPMAEETGAILEIGRWVMRTAISQARTFPPEKRLRVNVNVSARQLEEPDFVDFVARELERSGLEPSLLALEITESLALADIETAILRLGAIRALGVRIAIDDFGTGYSSLSHLKRLPVDQLKIDRSFICDGLESDEQGRSFVRAIIELGATLGLDTVAEGIEAESQMVWLREAGCRFGQGYLFARPLTYPDLQAALLEEESSLDDAGDSTVLLQLDPTRP